MLRKLRYDIKNIRNNDPAARSNIEVLLLYPSIHATINHRLAHWFFKKKLFLTN